MDTPFKKIAIILKWFEIQDVVKKILKVTCGNISPYKDIQVSSISLIVLDSLIGFVGR